MKKVAAPAIVAEITQRILFRPLQLNDLTASFYGTVSRKPRLEYMNANAGSFKAEDQLVPYPAPGKRQL